jgi:hypothetical protein
MHVNICWQYLLVLFARKSTCDWGMDDVVLRMVCCCCWFLMQWWLLWLPALLLLDRVLACLPFSSLVSFWWLAFSSWSGTAPPCLDLQLLWFNPWSILDGVLVCIGAVCKNSGVLVFVQCWSSELLSWWSSSSRQLVCSAAVVLTAQVFHAVTKLLELLVTRAWSDPLMAVLCICLVPNGFVPSDENRY